MSAGRIHEPRRVLGSISTGHSICAAYPIAPLQLLDNHEKVEFAGSIPAGRQSNQCTVEEEQHSNMMGPYMPMSDVLALEPLQRQCQELSSEAPVAHSTIAEHDRKMQDVTATGHQAGTAACGLFEMSVSTASTHCSRK